MGKLGLSGKAEDLQKDREKIRDGWASLKDYPAEVGGKTTIDKNGDAWKDYYTLVVKAAAGLKRRNKSRRIAGDSCHRKSRDESAGVGRAGPPLSSHI